jgi:NAD(P)-dependent dehydrogenase (short-subunit alcohol dehydrogenase family)
MSLASSRRCRRITQPADQAKVICFLASSDADFVTAVTVDVTGGQ